MKFNRRMTQVCEVIDLSPHMRRIVLTGPELHDFPVGKESAHVKVILPTLGESIPKLTFDLNMKKRMRSYTIRHFDNTTLRLSIDFAVNDHIGNATQWASNAKVGDYLGIAGPGEVKHTDFDADWHFIIADLTALPAAAATLEKLPYDAKGHALIQVPTSADIQAIKHPANIQIKWVVNGDLNQNALLETAKTSAWFEGTPAIFIATCSSHMKELRKYVESMPRFNKQTLYASSYWKTPR